VCDAAKLQTRIPFTTLLCLSGVTPLDDDNSFTYIRYILNWSENAMKFLKLTLEHVDDVFDMGVAFSLLALFSYCGFLVATWSHV
jgi:hypothetical protein